MADPISTPNPVVQPNTTTANPTAPPPSSPTPTPDPGFTSSDAAIQAQIKAMQQQAVAKSTQAAGPTTQTTTQNAQGQVVNVQSTPTGQTVQTGTQQTPVTYQQATVDPVASKKAAIQEVMKLNNISEAEATFRYENATAAKEGKVVMPTQGVSWDPATGKYKDPLTGAYFKGFNPQGGVIFTPAEDDAMSTIFSSGSGGILTTDAASAGVDIMGNVISKAVSSPLPHSGMTNGSGQAIDPKTGLAITTSSQEYDATFGAESANIMKQIDEWKKVIAETTDAETQAIAGQQKALLERKMAFIEDIHTQAKAQYDGQIEANKQAVERAKAFFARTGMLGSSQELQFVGDTIRQGEAALRNIADSERRAVNEAEFNFQQQDYQLAREKLQVAKESREQYMNLFYKQEELKQTFENMAMRRMEFKASMEQAAMDTEVKRLELQGKKEAAAQQKIGNLLAAGFDLNDDTAPEFMEIAKTMNWTPKQLKSFVDLTKGSMEAKQMEDMEARRTKELENANKLIDFFDKTGAGGEIAVGGITYQYQGQKAPDVYEGTERDAFGNVVHWTIDKKTGQTTKTNLGLVGAPQDGWTQVQTDQGWYFYNEKTGTYAPSQPSMNTTTLQAVFQEGSKVSPFRPGKTGVQCGALMNDCNDPDIGRIWGDSVEQKMKVIKSGNPKTGESWEVPLDQVDVGDTVVQKGSWTGHVMRVIDKQATPDGKVKWQVLEANMVPPGGEAISTTRWVDANDPKNLGAARVPTRQELQTGPDSPLTSFVMNGGPQPGAKPGVPTINGVPITQAFKNTADEKVLSPNELEAYGLDPTLPENIGLTVSGVRERKLRMQYEASQRDEQEFAEFADALQMDMGMSLAPDRLKKEWEAYKTERDTESAMSSDNPKALAQNMFDGLVSININNLPAEKKSQVAFELANLKRKALESGDTTGILRASAGGKDVDSAFIQSFEKGANVIQQIGDLKNLIISGGKDAEGNKISAASGPIWGIVRGNNPYDVKAREVQAKLTSIIPNLARGVYGEVGVLTDQDVALYAKTLPNLKDTESTNKAIMSATIRSVARSLERKLITQANAGRDVSGFVNQYMDLKSQADTLLAEANPNQYRYVNGALYEKSGSKWLMTK